MFILHTLIGEGKGTPLMVISFAPVLTILARVLAINLQKTLPLNIKISI